MLGHLTFLLVASNAVHRGWGGALEEGVHLAELAGCDGGGDCSEGWRMGSENFDGDPTKI